MTSHLIGAGDAQSVEKWDKNLRRDHRHDGVGEAEDPEGSSVQVSLRWCANDCDARHEAGSQWHGNRHSRHLPATQQELLAAGLLTTSNGLEEPHSCWDQNGQSEHHIIPHRESGHWTTGTDHGSFSRCQLSAWLFPWLVVKVFNEQESFIG